MHLKHCRSFSDIPRESWNRLNRASFPFARYEFLSALETSACVGKGSGWIPHYLTLWDGEVLAGAIYLYEKHDSFGEFIFDWEWAHAYHRYGLPYYPKLVAAVPYTPATGPKLLVAPGYEKAREQLASIALDWTEPSEASGLHFLFIPETELNFFSAEHYLIRHSFQYHWENPGYENFAAFLTTLLRKRRQAILSERRRVQESGVEIIRFSGEALNEEHARVMYQFCKSTFLKKNGTLPYLNEAFFLEIFRTMPESILLILARKSGDWVAGAINFWEGDTLFGRYWGCLENYRFLHFELCYYQAIEYAIERGIKRYEAGAGGRHKIQRGFLPQLCYSAHWLRHPAFAQAIGSFIEEEKKWVDEEMRMLALRRPFR